MSIDDLCLPDSCVGCGQGYETEPELPGLVQCPVQFDQGDCWMMSDWWSTEVDLAQIAPYRRVALRLFLTDKGDSIFDTVVLVDDVRIE